METTSHSSAGDDDASTLSGNSVVTAIAHPSPTMFGDEPPLTWPSSTAAQQQQQQQQLQNDKLNAVVTMFQEVTKSWRPHAYLMDPRYSAQAQELLHGALRRCLVSDGRAPTLLQRATQHLFIAAVREQHMYLFHAMLQTPWFSLPDKLHILFTLSLHLPSHHDALLEAFVDRCLTQFPLKRLWSGYPLPSPTSWMRMLITSRWSTVQRHVLPILTTPPSSQWFHAALAMAIDPESAQWNAWTRASFSQWCRDVNVNDLQFAILRILEAEACVIVQAAVRFDDAVFALHCCIQALQEVPAHEKAAVTWRHIMMHAPRVPLTTLEACGIYAASRGTGEQVTRDVWCSWLRRRAAAMAMMQPNSGAYGACLVDATQRVAHAAEQAMHTHILAIAGMQDIVPQHAGALLLACAQEPLAHLNQSSWSSLASVDRARVWVACTIADACESPAAALLQRTVTPVPHEVAYLPTRLSGAQGKALLEGGMTLETWFLLPLTSSPPAALSFKAAVALLCGSHGHQLPAMDIVLTWTLLVDLAQAMHPASTQEVQTAVAAAFASAILYGWVDEDTPPPSNLDMQIQVLLAIGKEVAFASDVQVPLTEVPGFPLHTRATWLPRAVAAAAVDPVHRCGSIARALAWICTRVWHRAPPEVWGAMQQLAQLALRICPSSLDAVLHALFSLNCIMGEEPQARRVQQALLLYGIANEGVSHVVDVIIKAPPWNLAPQFDVVEALEQQFTASTAVLPAAGEVSLAWSRKLREVLDYCVLPPPRLLLQWLAALPTGSEEWSSLVSFLREREVTLVVDDESMFIEWQAAIRLASGLSQQQQHQEACSEESYETESESAKSDEEEEEEGSEFASEDEEEEEEERKRGEEGKGGGQEDILPIGREEGRLPLSCDTQLLRFQLPTTWNREQLCTLAWLAMREPHGNVIANWALFQLLPSALERRGMTMRACIQQTVPYNWWRRTFLPLLRQHGPGTLDEILFILFLLRPQTEQQLAPCDVALLLTPFVRQHAWKLLRCVVEAVPGLLLPEALQETLKYATDTSNEAVVALCAAWFPTTNTTTLVASPIPISSGSQSDDGTATPPPPLAAASLEQQWLQWLQVGGATVPRQLREDVFAAHPHGKKLVEALRCGLTQEPLLTPQHLVRSDGKLTHAYSASGVEEGLLHLTHDPLTREPLALPLQRQACPHLGTLVDIMLEWQAELELRVKPSSSPE